VARLKESWEAGVHQSDPDVALMLAFRDGDEAAFDQLFHRWAGPLLRYMERMVGDAATAEELVQEAFFRVHKAKERYEPKARFSTWLYRIATNLALNELKRPRRRHHHEEEENSVLVAKGPSSETQIDSHKMGGVVEEILHKLPERQRVALWLSAAEGHSYAEVAQILETTEKSVKALVHRGRTALIERLGSREGMTTDLFRRSTA
jgi:RNA polymerase sigma-70 factor (ECF subfamily)